MGSFLPLSAQSTKVWFGPSKTRRIPAPPSCQHPTQPNHLRTLSLGLRCFRPTAQSSTRPHQCDAVSMSCDQPHERETVTHPYQNTPTAKLIADRIRDLSYKKTQAEIASEAGFANANMMTFLKTGKNKVPLDRVPSLARPLRSIQLTSCVWRLTRRSARRLRKRSPISSAHRQPRTSAADLRSCVTHQTTPTHV